MKRINGKKLLTILALCALGLSAIAAAPSSADAPQVLRNAEEVSAVLTGNSAGAFAYYAIDYPGDESVITIELRFNPADPVTKLGIGFNVYGPNGYLIGAGLALDNTNGNGVLRLEYADSNPTTWLVQVYNYLPSATINYVVVAEGLPETAEPATEEPGQVVTEPETPTEPAEPLTGSGSLTGNAGGAYAVYEVTVPADGSDVEVTMSWWPDDPVIAAGVGFVAWGPGGQAHDGGGTGTPGERTTTLPADEPGVYQIQVYNYIDGLTIQYTVRSAAAD